MKYESAVFLSTSLINAFDTCNPLAMVEGPWNSSRVSYKNLGFLQGKSPKVWNSLGLELHFSRNSSRVGPMVLRDKPEFYVNAILFNLQG